MVEPLQPIFDRVRRAEEHLEAIEGKLLAYYNADLCVITGEYKPNADGRTGTVVNDEVRIADIDPRLNTLIGELVHDLHSSLEHLARQLVLAAGHTENPGKTPWPILTTRPTTNRKGQHASPNIKGGISDAARTLVGSAQPYQWEERWPEHPLWLLHQLWNIDKHRDVIAKGVYTAIQMPTELPCFRFTTRLRHATEHGASLVIVPDEPSMNVDAHTFIQVAINEPEYGIERPLLRTLKEACEAVKGLLEAAKATCF